MTNYHIKLKPFLRKIKLNTKDYDFMIFSNVSSVKVSKSTIKIIRYHDSIPITDPDFFKSNTVNLFHKYLQESISTSYFVCNSESSKKELINFFLKVKNKVYVVAPQINDEYKYENNNSIINDIIKKRSKIFNVISGKKNYEINYHSNFVNEKDEKIDYVLSVATIEPRKNYINLIRAWNIANLKLKKKIKLIIVGGLGWNFEKTLSEINHFLRNNDIIHLN